jgi:hypothetical protein
MSFEFGQFRCGVKPESVVQQCTYCGAPGQWSEVPARGVYVAPIGHAIREDGTMECPRSKGDRVDMKRASWHVEGQEATLFGDADRPHSFVNGQVVYHDGPTKP